MENEIVSRDLQGFPKTLNTVEKNQLVSEYGNIFTVERKFYT